MLASLAITNTISLKDGQLGEFQEALGGLLNDSVRLQRQGNRDETSTPVLFLNLRSVERGVIEQIETTFAELFPDLPKLAILDRDGARLNP